MKILNKRTGVEVRISNRRDFANNVYSEISAMYSFISPLMEELIEKYKDVEITKHTMNEVEARKLMDNEDYIHDIPRYEVKGDDEEVSASRFDTELG